LVKNLVRDGVNGLMITGTLGEGHSMLWDEQKVAIETTVNAAQGVPVFAGTTSLGTREVIMKTKFAQNVGAAGVLLGVPMWCPQSVENTIQYYSDVAEAVKPFSILIYHNPSAFRVYLPPSAFEKLAAVSNIIGSKETCFDILHNLELVHRVKDRLSVLSIDHLMYPMMEMGTIGCWSSWAAMGPWPVKHLYELCRTAKWEEARELAAEIRNTFPPIDWALFHENEPSFMRTIFNEAGYDTAGPVRRPFVHLPESLRAAAVESGRKYKKLAAKYKQLVAA
jgi:hydratase-aldolase